MRTRFLKALALAAGLLAFAGNSQAAMIYRCGQTYQQVPCEGSKALNTAPAPSEEQRRQAQERADAERRLADQLTEDRHRQEAAEAKARAKDEAAAERDRKIAAKAAKKDKAAASKSAASACPSPVYMELAPGEKKKTSKPKSGCPTLVYLTSSAKPAASATAAQQPAPKKK